MKNKHAAIALFMSILLLVMSPSAFAAEGEAEKVMPIAAAGMEVSVAALQDVEVEVTVPAAKNLYINPLGFPVKIGDTTDIVTTVEKRYKGHHQRKRQREGFFSKSASSKPRNVR